MPLANHLSALPRIRRLIHISRLTLPGPLAPPQALPRPDPTATTTTKELTMRINPSDVLFLALSAFVLLAAALVIGGLAAHPFGPPAP